MRWRPKDMDKWHKWFAWYPVESRCGSTVWMETVWRRRQYSELFDTYSYTVFEDRPDICEDGHIPESTP